MAAPVSTLGTAALLLPARYRRHAKKIAIGIVLGCAAMVAAIATYNTYHNKQVAAVNNEFSAMTKAVYEGDLASAVEHFEFVKNEGGDFQTNIAALHLAYGHFENKEYAAAATLYEEVIATADTKAMKDTARLRLAKAFVAQGENQEALDILLGIESSVVYLELLTESLIGDIYLIENNLQQASEAYARARQGASELGDTDLLELLETRSSIVISQMLQQGVPGQINEQLIDDALALEQDEEASEEAQQGSDSN